LIPGLYALICLIWGSTWLVIKIGLVGVPPFLGAGLRFTLASAALFALIALRGTRIRLERDDKICVLSCGLLSFALSYACVYWAEQYISSGLAAVLYCTMPLATALLSRFWTRSEKLSGRKIGGILVAMAGTVALFWPGAGVSRSELAGTAVALASVFAAAVNLVMVKRHGRNTDIYVMNALGMAIGAILLLTLSALVESRVPVAWSRDNVLAIVYLALVGSVTAFLSYYSLVKVMEATKLSLITLIFPLVAVALGRVFLRESPPASARSGAAVVFLGVAIAIAPAPRRVTAKDAADSGAGAPS
jgi:drug/metabolite transporter (DMT)-like permease